MPYVRIMGINSDRPVGVQPGGIGLGLVMLVVGGLWLTGCSEPEVVTPRASLPTQIYTGPAYLRGTIGSLTRLRGANRQLVGGYGLVVNLKGTGSADVPAFLRVWLVNEMRKKGVGSSRFNFDHMTPDRVLASPNTAVVLVQGLVPPGAVKGSRYDVMVSALPQTQTTSLQGGRLWTADLAQGGQDPTMLYRRKTGQASGALYVGAFDPGSDGPGPDLQRRAVVLSGGVATVSRRLELILNQPSWQRSRAIADRINERFPRGPDDRFETAVPATDVLIRLNIPARFGQQPDELIALFGHLYLQRSSNFEPEQAQRLADLLVADPGLAGDVVLAWHALGKTILPVLRNYYGHDRLEIGLAAVDAGARLGDEVATDALRRIAEHEDPEARRRAARILVYLPDSIRGARTLHRLLDDTDMSVRIEAYESLASINDPIIQRAAVADRQGYKFLLDVVPSRKGLVYITQLRAPRLVVFGQDVGFRVPFLARLWNNRLMLRADAEGEPLTVFYQTPGNKNGGTYQIPPRLVDLVALLAGRPTVIAPSDGLDLSYGQVAGVVQYLCRSGDIQAELHLQISPLARAIEQAQKRSIDKPRPETGDAGSL